MNKSKNNLPYFNAYQKATNEKRLASFLLKKFRPAIKEKFPYHYLVQPIPHQSLKTLRRMSNRYPYFCRFDIKLYYPSIDHSLLIQELPVAYKKISGKPLSRRMKKNLKDALPLFLEKSPYNKGIPIGSSLSYALSGIYLLSLDLSIPFPFLRQTDDYLVFCKKKQEPEKLLKEMIVPQLNKLKLELNEKKLSSGKFHRDKVDFIGFDFSAGYFSIKEKKIEEFKKKIINVTHLTRKKTEKKIIKTLNNKILGFGHYYKFASCKKDLKKLDKFIRMRLRRYIIKNKDSKDRKGNFFFKNSLLQEMGLKSLVSIKEKYALKTHLIPKKKKEKRKQTCKRRNINHNLNLEEKAHYYKQDQVLKELEELTSLVKRVERRINKIERKLDG
jgi:RNA-directed DNA polymerase